MKAISRKEIPTSENYTCFYTEDIVKETERAFLVSLYFQSFEEKVNVWLPKSKMLAYTHVDNREVIEKGKDFVKNPYYGQYRVQYFISSYFAKNSRTQFRPNLRKVVSEKLTNENGTMFRSNLKQEYSESQIVSDQLIEKVSNMPSFQLAVEISKWVPFVSLRIEYYLSGFYLCCHGSFNVEPGFCSTFKTRPTKQNRLSLNETMELMKLLKD